MGEYATYQGQSIKIGTCENMYYLRADQRQEISDYEWDAETLGVVRFRFPFPDEDDNEPGHFDDPERGVYVPGYQLPAELSGSDGHGSVQFRDTRDMGYLVSLPCPESAERDGEGFWSSVTMPDGGSLRIGRNGFNPRKAGVQIRQQALRDGVWVTLLYCGACGAIHRLDTLKDAEPVIVALRAEADRTERVRTDWDAERDCWGDQHTYEWRPANSPQWVSFYQAVADRIAAGYVREEVTA